MAASAGLIAVAALVVLLCLRRLVNRTHGANEISDDEMQTYCRLSAESQNWSEVP